MKNRIFAALFCLTALFLGLTPAGKNFIRNGDFERFSGNEPSGWETTNLGKMLTVVSPVSKAHGGARAVKCEVKTSFGSPMPGMISQKNISVDGDNVQLSFYYILNSVGKDAGFLAVDFQNDEGSTVGMCQHYLTATASDFTLFRAVTKRPGNATHCEVRLTLMPEKDGGTLHDGSAIIVDDIELVALAEKAGQTP